MQCGSQRQLALCGDGNALIEHADESGVGHRNIARSTCAPVSRRREKRIPVVSVVSVVSVVRAPVSMGAAPPWRNAARG